LDNRERVLKDDDLQVQRCAGANENAERVGAARRTTDDTTAGDRRVPVTSIDATRTKFSVATGAETALPEFRKTIKDKYVRPSKCVSVPVSTCDGPGTYPPDRLDLAHVIPGKGEHPRCREERIA
jgi:hypothetical protein